MSKTQIETAFDATVRPMSERLLAFPWEDRAAYAGWIGQTYHFVNNSTRLIALAGSMFPVEANAYHRRFIEHAKEEFNHEKLCTTDLKHLGYTIEQLPELPVTSGFWQSQMYWIMTKGPMSFFGYILCLEGLAVLVGSQVYKKVVAAHGEKAGGFLRIHAEEDVDHLKQAFDLVKGVPAKEMDFVCANMRQCAGLYQGIADEIVRGLGRVQAPQIQTTREKPRVAKAA